MQVMGYTCKIFIHTIRICPFWRVIMGLFFYMCLWILLSDAVWLQFVCHHKVIFTCKIRHKDMCRACDSVASHFPHCRSFLACACSGNLHVHSCLAFLPVSYSCLSHPCMPILLVLSVFDHQIPSQISHSDGIQMGTRATSHSSSVHTFLTRALPAGSNQSRHAEYNGLPWYPSLANF